MARVVHRIGRLPHETVFPSRATCLLSTGSKFLSGPVITGQLHRRALFLTFRITSQSESMHFIGSRSDHNLEFFTSSTFNRGINRCLGCVPFIFDRTENHAGILRSAVLFKASVRGCQNFINRLWTNFFTQLRIGCAQTQMFKNGFWNGNGVLHGVIATTDGRTFQNGFLEQTIGFFKTHHMNNGITTGGLTKHGYVVRITAESMNVFLNPTQSLNLIHDGQVVGV